MSTKIFVNLPVHDLDRATEFYKKLGFSPDPRFSDERATCMVISDDIYAMLLTEPFFQEFTKREIPDPDRSAEAIMSLGVDDREQVDELADKAIAAGATLANDPMEEDFMYARSFHDPDGHLWEVVHVDEQAMAAQV